MLIPDSIDPAGIEEAKLPKRALIPNERILIINIIKDITNPSTHITTTPVGLEISVFFAITLH
jgi:hypothetical protein